MFILEAIIFFLGKDHGMSRAGRYQLKAGASAERPADVMAGDGARDHADGEDGPETPLGRMGLRCP